MDSITSRVSRLSSTRHSHGSPVRGLALEALSTNMQHEGKITTNEEEEQHPRTARTTTMDSVAQERAGHCSPPSSATFEYSYSYYPAEEEEGNTTVDDNSGEITKSGDATRQTVNDTATGMPCHTARLVLSDTSGQLLGTPLSPALHEGTVQPEQITARSTGSHNASLLATATPRESALQMSGHTPITFTHGAGPTTPVMAVASHDNSSSGTSDSLWQLRQRVAASRARLDKTDYYIARCIEAIGGRRDRIALLQHQLSQEEQRLSSYRDRTASMQVELRQGRDRRRVREELAMLADMYTEREIRLEALEQRRGALQELWAQLELLCGATTAPHPGDESPEHQDEAQHEEGEATHEQEDKDKEGNEEEEVARESSQLSVLSQSSASVLQNFLAGLLQEVETLAQICIQLPSPPVPMSHTTRRSQARRAASPDLRGFCASRDRDDNDNDEDERNVNNTQASQAGFFSFFGGATEDHLSAKPLSTFLSCAGRLQHSAWELEETLQLRARELASDAEEEELRRRCTTLMGFRGSVRSTARLTAPITTITTTTVMRGSTVCGNNEEEEGEESLGEPLRGTALMTPWADIEEGKGTATQDNNSDAAVAVEDGTRLSLSLMMPDLTLSARRLGSTGSGGSASARAQGGSNGAPVNSPRPHTPRSAMATNTSTSLTARQRDNGVPRATRKTVTLAPLLYAYPRLSFVSHQLDLEQGKVQKSYEQDIGRETEKRRVMVRRLKAAYKAQIEPPLREALRKLYEQRRTIVQELAALGVTEVTLQWQEQEELPRELLMQAARVGCCTGMTDPYIKSVFSEAERTQCSGMLGDVLLPVMLEGSVRVRSVSRRQAAAQRARRGDQLHSDEEEEDDERVQMLLPAPLQSSPLSLNTPNITTTTNSTAGVQAPLMSTNKSSSRLAHPQRYLRQVIVHPQDFVTATAPSRKSDDASHEQTSATRLTRTSDTATMEETELLAGRFSACRLSDFCPRRSGTCETPPLSSRGTQSSASGLRSSYGTSTHSSEPRSSATLTGTTTTTAVGGAATERRGGLMEGVTNDMNDESELHSTVPLARRAAPAEPPAAITTTSATLRERDSTDINTTVISNNSASSRAVRMTEKAQASTTTTARRSSLSRQARKAIHALRNAVKDTRTPLPTRGSPSSNGNRNMMALTPSAANDISNVSADSPEWFDAAAVKVTLCFAGAEAQRRRAVAEAREQHQRSLWVLREELARVNEANFAAQAQLQELEATYEAKRLQHASRVREAAAKLAETKNLLRSLVAEHAEWVSIRDDMQAMLDQQAHRHKQQHRHHHHNSNGSGGEHHHHHKRHSEEKEQQPRTARTPHAQ